MATIGDGGGGSREWGSRELERVPVQPGHDPLTDDGSYSHAKAIDEYGSARGDIQRIAASGPQGIAGTADRRASDNQITAARILHSLTPILTPTGSAEKVGEIAPATFEAMSKVLKEASSELKGRVTESPSSVSEFVSEVLSQLAAIDGVKDIIDSGTFNVPREDLERIGIEWVVDDLRGAMASGAEPKVMKSEIDGILKSAHTMIVSEVRGAKRTKQAVHLEVATGVRVSEGQQTVDGLSGKIALKKSHLESKRAELAALRDKAVEYAEVFGSGGEGTLFEGSADEAPTMKRANEKVLQAEAEVENLEADISRLEKLQANGAWRTTEMQHGDAGDFEGCATNPRREEVVYGGDKLSLSRAGVSAAHGQGFVKDPKDQVQYFAELSSHLEAQLKTLNEKKASAGDMGLHKIEEQEARILTKLDEAKKNLKTFQKAEAAIKKSGLPREKAIKYLNQGLLKPNGGVKMHGFVSKHFSFTSAVVDKKFVDQHMTKSITTLKADIESLEETKALSGGKLPEVLEAKLQGLKVQLQERQELCEAQSVSLVRASMDAYLTCLTENRPPHGQIFTENADGSFQIADQERYEKFMNSPEGFQFASGKWMETDFVLINAKNKKFELGMLQDQMETMEAIRKNMRISFDQEPGSDGVSRQADGRWAVHLPKLRDASGAVMEKSMTYAGAMVSFPLNEPDTATKAVVADINEREFKHIAQQSVDLRLHISQSIDQHMERSLPIVDAETQEGVLNLDAYKAATAGMTARQKLDWMARHSSLLMDLPEIKSLKASLDADEAQLLKLQKTFPISAQEIAQAEVMAVLVKTMPAPMQTYLRTTNVMHPVVNAIHIAMENNNVKAFAELVSSNKTVLLGEGEEHSDYVERLDSMAEMSKLQAPPKKKSKPDLKSVVDVSELAMGRHTQIRVRCKSAKDRTLVLVGAVAARFVNMKRRLSKEKEVNETRARHRFMYQGLGLNVCSENVGARGSKIGLGEMMTALVYSGQGEALSAGIRGITQST